MASDVLPALENMIETVIGDILFESLDGSDHKTLRPADLSRGLERTRKKWVAANLARYTGDINGAVERLRNLQNILTFEVKP